MGHKKREEPNLTPDLLHNISLWRKGHLSLPPPNTTTMVDTTLKKKNNIKCLQSITGLLVNEWEEKNNFYLQSLRAKVTGQIWVSSLIRKLWDTAWEMWNYINHTLHATNEPTKSAVLSHTSKIMSDQF